MLDLLPAALRPEPGLVTGRPATRSVRAARGPTTRSDGRTAGLQRPLSKRVVWHASISAGVARPQCLALKCRPHYSVELGRRRTSMVNSCAGHKRWVTASPYQATHSADTSATEPLTSGVVQATHAQSKAGGRRCRMVISEANLSSKQARNHGRSSFSSAKKSFDAQLRRSKHQAT